MSTTKTFFATRSLARASGYPVKDALTEAVKSGIPFYGNKRWYVVVNTKQILQEIFDKAASHLLNQNKKSLSVGGGRCMYRGEDNLMCAAGPFIDDSVYVIGLEGKSVNSFDVIPALRKSNFPVDNSKAVGLLSILQSCHDNRPVEEWKGRLTEIAKDRNLSVKVLKNF